MGKKPDFRGWATRNDVRCTDGRIIKKDAFLHNDGQKVPLVWNHQHNEVQNVLGHALLKNRKEGVYMYGFFNDTESGSTARKLVDHGDVEALSIYANQLKQNGRDVLHGAIREVSLVIAGANPLAIIEHGEGHDGESGSFAYFDPIIEHSDHENDEAIIYFGETLELSHSDDEEEPEDEGAPDSEEELAHAEEEDIDGPDPEDMLAHAEEETVEDVIHSLNEKQRNVFYYVVGEALGGESSDDGEGPNTVEHADTDSETVKDVLATFNEKQIKVLQYMVGKAIEDKQSMSHNDEDNKEEESMKQNVFDQESQANENVISHADISNAIADGKRYGSMKESFLQHGIENIDFLFPEAKSLNTPPAFIQRDMGWVQNVMRGVHHTPFSRIKSTFADITEDEARAKGYIKGNLKKEEVFSLLKRTTTPTTIYKKQKLDRDDVVDITDFDVIAWLKSEMRMMLDEEIARAILVGDGRLASSDDKINEQNIRPIWTDEDLYTVKAPVTVSASATDDQKAKAFIRAAIKARKNYKGSGEPTLYTNEDIITDCLLLEDNNGRVIYESVSKLATVLRVKEIVAVPVTEGLSRQDNEGNTLNFLGLIVNLSDYNVGADKGGAVNMFDDFDIDYNAQKYLIETRCSGALIKPFSAIALELKVSG